MNEMQVLFVQVVSFSMTLDMIQSGHRLEGTADEYQKRIDTGMQEMKERKRRGEGLSQEKYAADTLQALQDTPGLAAFRVFAEHCAFQSSILALGELPTLVQRLHREGLREWAMLSPDRVSLRPFAQEFFGLLVEQFQLCMTSDVETAQEIAELLYEVAAIYDFPMTDELRTKVEYFIDLTADEFGDYSRGPDETRVVN